MKKITCILLTYLATANLHSQVGDKIEKEKSPTNYVTAKFPYNETFENYISNQVNTMCNCQSRYKVGVVIDTIGRISDIKILRSFGKDKDVVKCQDALKDALLNSPLWIPASYAKSNKKYHCKANKYFFIQLN